MRLHPLLPTLALLAALLPGTSAAQAAATDMQHQLQERDALIRNLQQRVEALERRLGTQATSPAAAPASSAAQAPQPGTPAATATVPAAAAASTTPAVPTDVTASVEEDETARALERALVREGGFLLPPGSWELDPTIEYQYRGSRGLAIVQGAAGPVIADRTRDQHRATATVGLRTGLPGNSQVDLRLPWVAVQESNTATAAGLQQRERQTGVGDVELQFTQQLSRDRAGFPALLASANLKLPTGDFELGQPSPGAGFATLQGALTAVKRQDPLVFFGTVSYAVSRAHSYAGSRIRPGHAVGLKAGTLLAASPETSLRTGVELTRLDRTRVNGQEVAGSSTLSGSVELGLSTLLSRSTLLDITLGFGITPDAPDLRLSVSLPVRF
ncbi:hypothetical protein EZ313_20285 [Ramlibacter henchirensis]|uniref:Transporter n=1 Tax=Ramlibacter henchirensis TaxID=204072 RepID=A0A4Z0BRY2_9BURK|nr:transporter [Ramlibacter henchirensis]TFZ00785.1 hypothetical protein EZ313_20285 [Ramlibacter henchirensis]